MHHILILGSGKIGTLVAGLLADSGDYQVYLGDLQEPKKTPNTQTAITTFSCDINDHAQLTALIKKHNIQSVVSCLPYFCNPKVAEAAAENNLNYFDLTEDVEVTKKVRSLAKNKNTTFIPQCGLAPGFISIVANDLIKQFDSIEHVKMRVGALPLNVSNPLQYALTWSTDGVINEYGNPCEILANGEKTLIDALEGLEEIQLDGLTYEAFYTSGGVGSLIDTYKDKVKNMDYKTMRYPGHCEKLQFLMNDLGLNHKRDVLKDILEDVIPETKRDVVLVYVSVLGTINGKLIEENYAEKFYPKTLFGERFSAIQMTTASGICAAIDMTVIEKTLKGPLARQENIDFNHFLENRFGNYYHKNTQLASSGAFSLKKTKTFSNTAETIAEV
ncbi:saccharopine dehydrogenase NADP-binding domain-containing protein [Thiotrichales bacterium 19S3-7]|nr:saccharopine dehydrogenase NADP-binding domain-containing protein [Thiotrichales bacterium 19S3-7]MCF6802074.1 saccharopine dehydrogenase NADP-binding domain-containing protein [Thiotrichales bacterium 19S3-11]